MVTGDQAATHPPTILATLTPKPEREGPNPELKRTRSLTRTARQSLRLQQMGRKRHDGRFDAVATVMRVKDPDRRLGRA
jgi:hypothetical protein